MEKILILDNYDSFTYNIVHLLHELGTEVDIARNDRISVEEAGRYNRLMRWIYDCPSLMMELETVGYHRSQKLLTSRQVSLIVRHLGDP